MGIGLTQEQQELAEAVRGWIGRAVPPEAVRKLLDAPPGGIAGGRPAYWDGLAGQGLLGLHLPEGDGGGGGDLVDLAVVLEEAGRAALPGPLLASSHASVVLQRAGSQGELLRALGGGERIGAVALGVGSVAAVADPDGDGYVLDGVCPPVLSGAEADLLVVGAELARGGEVWCAVDVDGGALSVRPHESADPTRPTAEVRLDGVRVPRARVLDGVDSAYVCDLAAVLYAAEACGGAAWALHTAAEYAKVREQFGRPIGQFQAVKHLCADMLVRVEKACAVVWDAARAAAADDAHTDTDTDTGTGTDPCVRGLVAALGGSVALDAAYSCAKDCIQILGGIGFTWEHDAHLYYKRLLTLKEVAGGSPGQLEELASLILD